jgi:hypothetical protein
MKPCLLILFVIFSFIVESTLAQENICECCAHSSLQFREEYETIFFPALIKKKNITEVVVYTQASITENSSLNRYKEITFKFNQRGQIIARTHYNRNGKPHSIHEFERNGTGKIFRETFNYLDSTEQVTNNFSSPEITDYYYDLKNRLIKMKERNTKGIVMPDIMSDYTKYTYDKTSRITKRTIQYYYDNHVPESSSSVTTYTYKDKKLSGESQTIADNKVSLTTKTQYTKQWKPLRETGYNGKGDKVSFQTLYEYNLQGKMTRYETKAFDISSECPDNGTYTDVYMYSDEGLLLSITHTYEDKKCEMIFEYRTQSSSGQVSSGL